MSFRDWEFVSKYLVRASWVVGKTNKQTNKQTLNLGWLIVKLLSKWKHAKKKKMEACRLVSVVPRGITHVKVEPRPRRIASWQ
jgi:hypothetical protein